jgi:hypothetical protein
VRRSITVDLVTIYSNVAAPSDNGSSPATQFQPSTGAKKVRCRREMRRRTGTIETIPAVQFTNDLNDLSRATVVNLGSTWQNADGTLNAEAMVDIISSAEGKQYMRFGWVTRNASGTGTGLSLCLQAGQFDVEFG